MRRACYVGLASIAVAPSLVGGCSDSIEGTLGLEEPIRVGYFLDQQAIRAQFFAGDLPEPNGGPEIAGLDIGPSEVTPGKQGKSGYVVRLSKEGYAVAVRVQGRTNGYWIARVTQVEQLFADQVSASLYFDVDPSVSPGVYRLEFAGVSADRRFGTSTSGPLRVESRFPPNAPAVIQLIWDAPVDLDLQLRAPDGTHLDPKHPTTAPPGTPDAGNAPGYGRINGDSMASCTEDALREEDVVFDAAPLPGKYQIYVNPFDLCRKLGTNYVVSILRNGNIEQQFFGRISEVEVQRGGFGIGDFVTEVTF